MLNRQDGGDLPDLFSVQKGTCKILGEHPQNVQVGFKNEIVDFFAPSSDFCSFSPCFDNRRGFGAPRSVFRENREVFLGGPRSCLVNPRNVFQEISLTCLERLSPISNVFRDARSEFSRAFPEDRRDGPLEYLK